jgi:DNA primase
MKRYSITDKDLKSILLNGKLNNRTNQYSCDCPFCNKDGHLYIDKTTQLWQCKKCGEQGNIYKLLRYINRLDLLQGATVEYKTEINSIRSLLHKIEDKIEYKELSVIKLPVGFKIGDKNSYLHNRGLTTEDIENYKIGYTNLLKKFDNYVIIPVYDNLFVRGFLARYANKTVPKNILRYNNSLGTNFAGLLYGYDEIIVDKTDTVILVEGVFDKFKLDRFWNLQKHYNVVCCSTFGKKISDYQIHKLMQKRITNVILAFDKDAVKEIKVLGLELQKYFITTIACTDGKDWDDSTDEQIYSAFEKLKIPAEFINSIIRKI